MASRYVTLLSSAMLLGMGPASLMATDATAGDYKTLDSGGLGVGGTIGAYSTPKSFGQAVEMEFYEFATAADGGGYRCRITNNATGQLLILRMLGVNGGELTSCATTVGGLCDTPAIGLGGNFKFVCLVSTQNGAPVASNAAWYRIEVNRTH